ncbi:hypothetical protein D3C87_1678900 [compost metagenome]
MPHVLLVYLGGGYVGVSHTRFVIHPGGVDNDFIGLVSALCQFNIDFFGAAKRYLRSLVTDIGNVEGVDIV